MNVIDKRKIIEKALHDLGEHFDAVQILSTFVEEGVTMRCFQGTGNFYARQGMAHEFINTDLAEEMGAQIAKQLNPPDES